ncbi:DNA topoisomerase 2-associated protein pat1 [Golovinomyces cichoracearum]|uniref:DNA topoisomerase 2-associated protein pat1 n=1 Tax=Golovinomyces cichoracearum TaxID=62708 RepID=A0A420IJX2_9PEZI|nr:DNA topoisomerase 2-associated protein pat1 [Golovinomyces cichoracearum]
MTFLGTSDDHNGSIPGFDQGAYSVCRLSRNLDEDIDALDIVDTYDGLGDQLEETGDDLNDDTFGDKDDAGISKPVGNDYDFFGRTAIISDAISEDQARFNSQKSTMINDTLITSPQSMLRSARVGLGRYSQPDPVPELRVDASIWGVKPKRTAPVSASETLTAPVIAPSGRKMMSVEELESCMLAQSMTPSHQQAPPQKTYQQLPQRSRSTVPQQQFQHYSIPSQDMPHEANRRISLQEQPFRPQNNQQLHFMHRAQQSTGQIPINLTSPKFSILQNPNRSCHDQNSSLSPRNSGFFRPSLRSHHINHQHQIANLSDEEKATALMDEAKREKRNRKIFLLSRDNGFMTPQDKSFINKIQLQQLVTATGNPNDHGSDLSFTEDFYYQVHHQIHGGHRELMGNTYSLPSGKRYGGTRKQIRGSTSHMQQMEQQVQRAVEAAKNRTKNKQSVIEGTLGKISFSNAKTPKPLLHIRLPESGTDNKLASMGKDRKLAQANTSGSDRKTVLTDIEKVYNTLMQMEDHHRRIPPPILEKDENNHLINLHNEWREKAHEMNKKLWLQLKVHEPIGATTIHPFIAFLSYGKGMKAVPRVFRHISQEQRTTILTMIILHLDQLDMVRHGLVSPGQAQLSADISEKIELFSLSVMPPLFGYLNETGLDIITGILGLLLTINIHLIARTRIGISMLTMILSRAELIKQAKSVNEEQEWDQWISTYNSFFDTLEPELSEIFPGSVDNSEDVYVWQFLAAIGICASPKQQQRIVMAVKDRVMETVSFAKSLPPTISSQRLGNVNLFMRSIGLDVELLA